MGKSKSAIKYRYFLLFKTGDHIENIVLAVLIGIVFEFVLSLICLLKVIISKKELYAVKVLSIIGMIPLLLIGIMWAAYISFS